MKTKTFMSAFLALAMSVGMMSAVSAAEATDILKPDINGKVITVDTKEELKWISAYSNGEVTTIDGIPTNFGGCTIEITADIDLENEAWTPIKNFRGTMDGVPAEGESYVTISRLNVTGATEGAGLCGNVSYVESYRPSFSDLRISESTITTAARSDYAGAFIADGYVANFDNCHVYNTSVTGYRYVGGICGRTYGNIKNCTVTSDKDNVVYANSDGQTSSGGAYGDNAGGIVGQIGEGNTLVYNCEVSGMTIKANRQSGGIVGLASYGNTIEKCTVSDTTVQALTTLNLSGMILQRYPAAGGICGQIEPSNGSSITFKDNIVNDTVSVYGATPSTTNYCGWILGNTRGATIGTGVIFTNNTYPSTVLNQYGN